MQTIWGHFTSGRAVIIDDNINTVLCFVPSEKTGLVYITQDYISWLESKFGILPLIYCYWSINRNIWDTVCCFWVDAYYRYKSLSARKKHCDSLQICVLWLAGKVIKASSFSQGWNNEGIFTAGFGTVAEDSTIRWRRENREALPIAINRKVWDNNSNKWPHQKKL